MNKNSELIEKWFNKGIEAAQRQNRSGCCCRFDENDNIISLCAAHKEYFNNLLKEKNNNTENKIKCNSCQHLKSNLDRAVPFHYCEEYHWEGGPMAAIRSDHWENCKDYKNTEPSSSVDA